MYQSNWSWGSTASIFDCSHSPHCRSVLAQYIVHVVSSQGSNSEPNMVDIRDMVSPRQLAWIRHCYWSAPSSTNRLPHLSTARFLFSPWSTSRLRLCTPLCCRLPPESILTGSVQSHRGLWISPGLCPWSKVRASRRRHSPLSYSPCDWLHLPTRNDVSVQCLCNVHSVTCWKLGITNSLRTQRDDVSHHHVEHLATVVLQIWSV